ncbi:putative chain length determinant protein, Wzz family [Arcobacter acticola]|uniref:Putative chain length determinant protein, Wzz family n=1 Tax=Arcobacter acticola TaxID=1849015 RepID=A0A6M8EJH3_9BACT|nr:Wzz/FepE/Etk N-terminal domain-containing protein [Arcobacter acticola]QKE28139.1 putative chain length determinant protein, Wzz family [Arcobacter acticola]
MEEKVYVEEEIDLRDLFKTIWDRRIFILVFTLVVTLLAIVYVSIKTPIYEVKALLEIGSYKTEIVNEQGQTTIETKNLDDANELSKKLSMIFIDLKENEKDKEFEITKINLSKGLKNFIEVSSESTSNDLGIKGLNEIVTYTKAIHSKLLKDVKEKNDLEIKNIDLLISNIQTDKIVNINKKIELYDQNIINLEEQMKSVIETLKNMNTLDYSITALKLMEKRDISNEIISNKSKLYDLIEQKENITNIDLNKLLERKKLLETLSLPHNFKNTEIVGNILTDDNPIKPKKKLIVVVAFVTGFILAIFMVFFIQFVNGIRKEK